MLACKKKIEANVKEGAKRPTPCLRLVALASGVDSFFGPMIIRDSRLCKRAKQKHTQIKRIFASKTKPRFCFATDPGSECASTKKRQAQSSQIKNPARTPNHKSAGRVTSAPSDLLKPRTPHPDSFPLSTLTLTHILRTPICANLPSNTTSHHHFFINFIITNIIRNGSH